MIRALHILVLLFIAAPLSAAAVESDDLKLANAYRSERLADWIECEVALNSAEFGGGIMTPVDYDSYNDCIRRAKATATANFESALKAMNKPAARAAFSQYHAASLAAFDGMRQRQSETEVEYKRRKERLNADMQSNWGRYEGAR